MTELDEWLIETRKKNFNLDELVNYIGGSYTCNFNKVFSKLPGMLSSDKAKMLYDLWNIEKQFKYYFY